MHPSSGQTTADVLQLEGSLWSQTCGLWFHWENLLSWLLTSVKKVLSPVMLCPHNIGNIAICRFSLVTIIPCCIYCFSAEFLAGKNLGNHYTCNARVLSHMLNTIFSQWQKRKILSRAKIFQVLVNNHGPNSFVCVNDYFKTMHIDYQIIL